MLQKATIMRRVKEIPISIVNLRLRVAEQFGGDRLRILSKVGLTEDLFTNPSNKISIAHTMEVWRAIIEETGREDIGLKCGQQVKFPTLGVLGYVMMNSDSMGQAVDKLCKYQRLVASLAFWEKSQEFGYTTYELQLMEPWEPLFRYTIDFMVIGVTGFIKDNTARALLPTEIALNYEPTNQEPYHEIFSPAQIRFNSPSIYIKYLTQDLNNPILGSNHEMLQYFEQLLADKVYAHDAVNLVSRKVRETIRKSLTAEIPSVQNVARELTMSVRSLQQHLKQEGYSYRSLLREVRRDLAIEQLKRGKLSITDITFLAGFSDISVFSRNFKKWTGLSPSQFQAQHI